MTLRNWNVSYSHSPLSAGIPTLSYHSCLHPASQTGPGPSQILFRLMISLVVANLAAAPLRSVASVLHIIYCRVDI